MKKFSQFTSVSDLQNRFLVGYESGDNIQIDRDDLVRDTQLPGVYNITATFYINSQDAGDPILQVTGTFAQSDPGIVYDRTAATREFEVDYDGRVGIRAQLANFGSENVDLGIIGSSGINGANIAVQGATGQTGGFVGIRTEGTPAGTWDIFEIDADGWLLVDTNTFVVDASNDRIGINTDTPTHNLHVVGNAFITDDLQIGTSGGGTVVTGDRVTFQARGGVAVSSANIQLFSENGRDMFFRTGGISGDIHIFLDESNKNTRFDFPILLVNGSGAPDPPNDTAVLYVENNDLKIKSTNGAGVTQSGTLFNYP